MKKTISLLLLSFFCVLWVSAQDEFNNSDKSKIDKNKTNRFDTIKFYDGAEEQAKVKRALKENMTAGEHLIKAGKNYNVSLNMTFIGLGSSLALSLAGQTEAAFVAGGVSTIIILVTQYKGNKHLKLAGAKLTPQGISIPIK